MEVLQGEVVVLFETPAGNNEFRDLPTPYQHLNSKSQQFMDSTISYNGREIAHNYGPVETSSKSTAENVSPKHMRIALGQGERILLPTKSLHRVITTSSKPSSFMYTFINSTLQRLISESDVEISTPSENTNNNLVKICGTQTPDTCTKNMPWFFDTKRLHSKTKVYSENREKIMDVKGLSQQKNITQDLTAEFSTWQDFINFFTWKSQVFMRSGKLLLIAFESIVAGEPMGQN